MRSRYPRSSREQPSHSRCQDLPQPRSGERESFEGHFREQYYRHRDQIRGSGDTDFPNNEQHFQLREDNKRSEDRLPESPKMQGNAYRKSAEQIQMEKNMGFSSFHKSRDEYFDDQSTAGSAKAGFNPSIKEEKIESPGVKQEFKQAKRDFDQTLDFANKIEFTDDADIKPKLEIKEQKTDTLEFKIEIKKELKIEMNEEPLNVKEETDDEMKTGLAVLDTLDFDTRRDTDNGQFDTEKELYHESKTQHKCTICDQDYFGHKGHLKDHVIAFHVHNMRIHKCSLCDEDFSRKVPIIHHIANAHEGKGKPMYKCLSCENKFFKISEMNHHIISVHERKGPIKCPLCEKVFPQKNLLMEHIVRIHEEKRNQQARLWLSKIGVDISKGWA